MSHKPIIFYREPREPEVIETSRHPLLEMLNRYGADRVASAGTLSALQREIDSGALPVADLFEDHEAAMMLTGALALHHDDPVVAKVACGILSSAATDPKHEWVLHACRLRVSDVLPVLRIHADTTTAVAAMSVLKILSVNARNVEPLTTGAALAAIKDAMERHQDSVDFVRHACGLLSCLASRDATRRPLAASGIGQTVAAAFSAHLSDATIADDATRFLSHVAVYMPGAEQVKLAAAFVAALRLHSSSETATLGILTSLAALTRGSRATAAALVTEGHSFAILSAVQRHGRSAKVAMCGCLLLMSMAADPAHHSRLVSAGAAPALVAVLRLHQDSTDVIMQACNALMVLAHGEPATQMLLQSEGVAPLLVGLLRRHLRKDPTTVAYVCGAIEPMRLEAAKAQMAAEGAVPLLVEALKAHEGNALVTQKALECLASLHQSHDDMLEAGRSGALKAVVEAMRRHSKNEAIVGASLSLMAKASANAEPRDALIEAGAPALIAVAVRGLQRDPILVQFGAIALAFMCRGLDEPELKKLVKGGVVAAMMTTLRNHSRRKAIVEAVCETLAHVARGHDNRPVLMREGCVPALVSAAQAHPDDLRVAKQACIAFYLLALNPPSGAEGTEAASAGADAAGEGHVKLKAFDISSWASTVTAAVSALVKHDAIPAIAAALDKHGEDAELARVATMTLLRIGAIKANRPPLANLSVIAALARTLRRHKEDAHVVAAVVAILNVVSELPAAWPLFADSGAVPALIMALRLHGGETVIVYDISCAAAKAAADRSSCELMAKLDMHAELDAVRTRYGATSDVGKMASAALIQIVRAKTAMEKS